MPAGRCLRSAGVEVIATSEGRTLAERARPVHAAAVRRYLADPLDGLDLDNLRLALERLAGGDGPYPR
jgi:hypothetical protein